MGSSSKKQGTGAGAPQAAAAPKPPPTMGMTPADPNGVQQQYYANLNEVPQSGGFVMPRGPAGAIGRNWYTPPPPPPPAPRAQLAQTIAAKPFNGESAGSWMRRTGQSMPGELINPGGGHLYGRTNLGPGRPTYRGGSGSHGGGRG